MKRINMKKKSLALFLVMAMAAASMTGCGDKKAAEEPATEVNFADIAGNTPEETTEAATEGSRPRHSHR